MPQIWVPTNVLHINLRPGGENSDLTPANKVSLRTLCALDEANFPEKNLNQVYFDLDLDPLPVLNPTLEWSAEYTTNGD